MTSAYILFGIMLALLALGVPVAFSIGIAGSSLLLITHLKDLILIPQRTIIGMDSFVLLAIPLFTLAGYLMEEGGLSRRLVNWAQEIFGFFPGSSGTIAIICCTVFAALTGSGPATVAAIGALMIPVMLENGYPKYIACAIIAAGGALGPIVPPSVPMIVYGSTMNLSIPKMFAGSLLPGLMIAALMILVNTVIAIKLGIKTNDKHYTIKDKLLVTWKALAVLMLPVIVLGGIYGGFFTPTEAASVCTVYSIILSIAYKSLNLEKFLAACKKTVYTSSVVMFICGVANLFSWILAATRIPSLITEAVIPFCNTKFTYFIIMILVLLFVGCLIDAISAILILGPILIPIGVALGINELHLGIVFCVTLIVGFITPPFGINLFTVCSTAQIPFASVVKGIWPFILVAVVGVVLLCLFPQICLILPGLIG